MIRILDAQSNAVLFTFDCELGEDFSAPYQWTDKPIESGASVAKFGVSKPKLFNFEGMITASPFDTGYDPTRIGDQVSLLVSIADKKQPVKVSGAHWAPVVVIGRVGGGRRKGDAEQIPLKVDCKTITIAKVKTVDIPPARMKPKKKKRAPKGKKGGTQTGKPNPGKVTAKRKTLALRFALAAAGK